MVGKADYRRHTPAGHRMGRAATPDGFLSRSERAFRNSRSDRNVCHQSGNVGLRKLVKKFDGDWPKEISGLLVLPRSTNSPALTNSFRYIIAYDVKLPVSETAPTNKLIARGPIPPNPVGILDFDNWDDFLWLSKFLLYAFIGGLVLNIMPCVLPVIALKVLGFVSEATSEPRRVRNLGLIYALGVLVSFLALAAVVI